MSELTTIQIGDIPITLPAFESRGAGGGFAFGVYKGGSTMLFTALRKLTRKSDVAFIDFVNLFHKDGVLLETTQLTDANVAEIENWLREKGTVFGGWRQFPVNYRLPFNPETASYLLVRDPRDVVTSHYFSLKYSHRLAGASGGIVSRAREQLQSKDIDAFALSQAQWLLKIYKAYKTLDSTALMLRRYEDVVFDKERMLSELCEHFCIDSSVARVKEIAKEIDKRPEDEDVSAHVRQVTPGDHRKKLKPETIETLNASLAPILSRYGYN